MYDRNLEHKDAKYDGYEILRPEPHRGERHPFKTPFDSLFKKNPSADGGLLGGLFGGGGINSILSNIKTDDIILIALLIILWTDSEEKDSTLMLILLYLLIDI